MVGCDRQIHRERAGAIYIRKISSDIWDFDFTDRPGKLVSKVNYGFKKIEVVLYYMQMMRDEDPSKPGKSRKRCMCLSCCGGKSFEMLAKMMWDRGNSRIILTPMIISEVHQ